jgi:beta-lactamase superfamily II metal-dependent hydrolase
MQTKDELKECLKRTFHAVGQGAFYTEQFDGGLFTVVYDCGSVTGNHILRERIDTAFCENTVIDALFISHFHADHINGIEHLLKRCVVKKIFLPVLDSRERIMMLLLCLIDGLSKNSFVYQFVNNPAEAVKNIVRPETGGNISPDEPGSEIIEIRETTENTETPIDNVNVIIGSGTRIMVDNKAANWVYIPFNFREESRYNEIKKYIEAKCSETDFTKIIENWDDYKEKLRDIYNYIPGDLNTNSLVLYSGPGKEVNTTGRIACLFTGDYNLKDSQNWNAFECKYREYLKNILVLQVPHHGSKHNFNEKLLETQIPCFVISAGKCNQFKHPDSCVKKSLNGKLFLVNECSDTCFFCLICLKSNCILFSSVGGVQIPDLIGPVT